MKTQLEHLPLDPLIPYARNSRTHSPEQIAQAAVFPLFGLRATASQHLAIGAIFTAVSLVRSYALRRVFNRIG